MAVSKQEIMALAKLAKLDFDEKKCEEFAPEFDEIIEFANRINQQVEGGTDTIREVTSRTVRWEELREDTVKESLPNEKILSNVESDNGCFAVKRVVK